MTFASTKRKKPMSKTIIECMYGITEKMRDPEARGEAIIITPDSTRKAAPELRFLRKTLSLDTMQVIILTAIVQKSSRYRIDGDDIASFLGMGYLQFLTHDSDLEVLKKRGFIRKDREGHISIPQEVMRLLKDNKSVEPEPTTGLSTGKILSRIKKLLAIRDDDEISTYELSEEIWNLMKDNPDTGIARFHRKHFCSRSFINIVYFYAIACKYWFDDDDMIGWHDVDDYFDDEELDDLRDEVRMGVNYLQREKIIEFTGEDGVFTKDYLHIRDEVKEVLFEEVGGLRKKEQKVSASRKIQAKTISEKSLFYNGAEERQVRQLHELMSEERFSSIRETMKAQNYRTGFTCLFYGAPGTGKTETVYQIARESGRDLFVVDVSQIKSCWVGESEKNIKAVFSKYRECVRGGGTIPILLFNEADAIFGIRSEGAGSAVDKMENSIQNIILQEMEDLDGILMATTNLTTNLDKAFERRFLYKIRFEKPSAEARALIWKQMIPELSEEEAERLAREFDFSGGQIENIARKKTVKALISGAKPSFEDILEYCSEENIEASPQRRKIGF